MVKGVNVREEGNKDMKDKIVFIKDFIVYALKGGTRYYIWLLFLLFVIFVGIYTSYKQFTVGLILTGSNDVITWELFIANFVFMVGVAASAVTMVFPAYVYKRKDFSELYVLGEVIALVATPLCILFIVYHMGRPDRLWHIIPGLGYFNIPNSMLDFDVIALNGYIFINLIGILYYLYKRYSGKPINKKFYIPFMFLAIIWAPSIHIVTGFILSTLTPVELWTTPLVPVKFLPTAFASGDALIIIILLIIRKYTKLSIPDSIINILSQIVAWCLGIVIIMSISEIVTELYQRTEHAMSMINLIVGLHGNKEFVPFYWISATFIVVSFLMLLSSRVRKDYKFLLPFVCVLTVVGILIDKGVGLVLPGFIPSPLGEYVVYRPTFIEIYNTLFIWVVGAFALTLLLKGTIGVLVGDIGVGKQAGGH